MHEIYGTYVPEKMAVGRTVEELRRGILRNEKDLLRLERFEGRFDHVLQEDARRVVESRLAAFREALRIRCDPSLFQRAVESLPAGFPVKLQ